jgi:hypothetical protein
VGLGPTQPDSIGAGNRLACFKELGESAGEFALRGGRGKGRSYPLRKSLSKPC